MAATNPVEKYHLPLVKAVDIGVVQQHLTPDAMNHATKEDLEAMVVMKDMVAMVAAKDSVAILVWVDEDLVVMEAIVAGTIQDFFLLASGAMGGETEFGLVTKHQYA